MAAFTIRIKGKEYRVSSEKGKLTINDDPHEVNTLQIRESEFHVLKNSKSYNVEVVSASFAEKKMTLRMNGNEYDVEVKDRFDLLLDKMGMTKSASHALGVLKAPMPGKVLKVIATEGQEIKKGDNLLILEAMKMENSIKSPGDGVVKKILVKKGDALEKGVVMIEFK